MSESVIRPMQAADMPVVVQMVHALAAHHGDQGSLDVETLRRDALGPAPWLSVLVAERRGMLQGYAALCPLAQLQFGKRGMDMQNLFVQPSARGQGVGAALVAGCRAHARALGCVYLAVGTHPGNVKAAEFYLRQGFEQRPPPGPRLGQRLVDMA